MSVFTSPATVSVPWTPVFPDPFYVCVCSDEAPTSADSALAIKANSKLPGSLQVIPELPASGGVVHCMASHISGDVNGDGVVNCVDLDTVKASLVRNWVNQDLILMRMLTAMALLMSLIFL